MTQKSGRDLKSNEFQGTLKLQGTETLVIVAQFFKFIFNWIEMIQK